MAFSLNVFLGKYLFPVLSLVFKAKNSVARSSGVSAMSSKFNRFRQHHEILIFKAVLVKTSMSFTDLVFTLSKSLTAVFHGVYVFVHLLKLPFPRVY